MSTDTVNSQKILILGKGFIGNYMYEYFTKFFDTYIINKAQVDYTDRETLTKYINSTGPYEFIINACGYTGKPNVDACEDDKDNVWLYNVITPVNIQKVCKDTGHKLIHISSGCIYDGYEKHFTETDEPNFGLASKYSSWYSKTKHAAEMMLKDRDVYTLRVRMPYCRLNTSRNYLMKLIKYDRLIDQKNSMTCVEDFIEFVLLFMLDIIDNKEISYGIYNVVNPDPMRTHEIVELLEQYEIGNDNWSYVPMEEFKTMVKANRSNCILNSDKINDLELTLPDTFTSMQSCIKELAENVRRSKKSHSK